MTPTMTFELEIILGTLTGCFIAAAVAGWVIIIRKVVRWIRTKIRKDASDKSMAEEQLNN